jgi:uncharacterized protein with FMN-binding domain
MELVPASRVIRGALSASGLVAAGLALAACTPTGASPATPSATTTPPDTATALRDGEYNAKGWYGSGPSSIDVTLTLENGTVTAVEVEPNATDPTSLNYQRRFASGVDDLVVGRPLSELGDVVVSGSSSTPAGFDDAVRKIRRAAS